MDTEKFIDGFAKKAKEHLQQKVNVAGKRMTDERTPHAEFWMGNLVAYEEIADWFDALFDDDLVNHKMKVSYPAVFDGVTNNGQDIYSVSFPDLKDCYACGPGLMGAVDSAKDVLTTYLKAKMDSTNEELPEPSSYKDIKERYPDHFVLMITANIKNKVI